MAANFQILCTIILLLISSIPQSSSQSNSQNIQTFYPFSPPQVLPPPSPDNDPRNILPPTTLIPPPPPRKSSNKTAVGTAIGVTAASTLVLSGLLFFLLLRRSRRKNDAAGANGGTNAVSTQNDNFTQFNGNVKGLIVDENGLDVLYWKNLQEGENRSSFKREYYKSLQNEQKEEEKRVVSDRKNKPPVHEVPLLRGRSSTSQSPVWGDAKDQIIQKAHSRSSFKIEKQLSSVQLTNQTPPPLPPPQQQLLAVPKEILAAAAAPPPPPPVPLNKGPTPPPPPLPVKPPAPNGPRSSLAGEGSQMKFKPLHWDKVNPDVEHSMVWDKIDKGSFKFDGELMEALFGYVATNRKSPQRDSRSTSPPSQIFILDTRKSQNTAIVLKSLGISREEIIEALTEGEGLNADTIEKLTKIAPTDEEASQIIEFDGDPARLADAESFLYHILKTVPSAFSRFKAMLFRSNFDLEVSQIKEWLQSLESACNELRTRGLFLKLLEAVLKAGNRLNAGTSRGNAQAFNLTALRKLSDVKSSDGKTTLLQFVVQEVVRAEGKRCVLNRNRSLSRTSSHTSQSSDNSDDKEKEYMMLGLPLIGGLSAEFSNVKKAASLDYDLLIKSSSALAAQVVEIRKIMIQCGDDQGFVNKMNGFLDTAELEIKVVKEDETRAMELVKKTSDYYQAGSSKNKGTNSFQLFVIVRDFLGMVDQVCIEIARDVQKRKSVSSVAGSSSPDSPRVFRFPRLPANFMSDNSKSGSSDLDNDSDVKL